MILPTMNDQEIANAVLSEKEYVLQFAKSCKDKFHRMVLKTNKFPFFKTFSCTTKNKVDFYISFRADKRGDHSKPSYSTFAKYKGPKGSSIALIENDWSNISIFPTHFFDRYKLRILKDTSIDNDTAILKFINSFCGYCDMWLDDEKNKQIIEKAGSPEEKVNMFGAFQDGVILGANEGKVCVACTVVSYEMLFEDQKSRYQILMDELLANIRDPRLKEIILTNCKHYQEVKS